MGRAWNMAGLEINTKGLVIHGWRQMMPQLKDTLENQNLMKSLRDTLMSHPDMGVRSVLKHHADSIQVALEALGKTPTTTNLKTLVGIWTRAFNYLVDLNTAGPTPPTAGTPEITSVEAAEDVVREAEIELLVA